MAGEFGGGRISRAVPRQRHQADQVARPGSQRLQRTWEFVSIAGQRRAPANLRVAGAARRVGRFRGSRICPLGPFAHPIKREGLGAIVGAQLAYREGLAV